MTPTLEQATAALKLCVSYIVNDHGRHPFDVRAEALMAAAAVLNPENRWMDERSAREVRVGERLVTHTGGVYRVTDRYRKGSGSFHAVPRDVRIGEVSSVLPALPHGLFFDVDAEKVFCNLHPTSRYAAMDVPEFREALAGDGDAELMVVEAGMEFEEAEEAMRCRKCGQSAADVEGTLPAPIDHAFELPAGAGPEDGDGRCEAVVDEALEGVTRCRRFEADHVAKAEVVK